MRNIVFVNFGPFIAFLGDSWWFFVVKCYIKANYLFLVSLCGDFTEKEASLRCRFKIGRLAHCGYLSVCESVDGNISTEDLVLDEAKRNIGDGSLFIFRVALLKIPSVPPRSRLCSYHEDTCCCSFGSICTFMCGYRCGFGDSWLCTAPGMLPHFFFCLDSLSDLFFAFAGTWEG